MIVINLSAPWISACLIYLNVRKRKIIHQCLTKSIELAQNSHIESEKLGRYFLILFSKINSLIFLNFISNYFMNFKITFKTIIFFIFASWNNFVSLYIMLLCVYFFHLILVLLKKISTDMEMKKIGKLHKTQLEILKIHDLLKLFHKAFGTQMSFSLCHALYSTVVVVN